MGIIEADPGEELRLGVELPPDHTSLDYLQAVYRGQIRSDPSRMRAAIAALQFEHPKLSAAAVVHDDGTWAERLEKAIERSGRGKVNGNGDGAKVINGEGTKPKVIEHDAGPGLRRI
jgi:hypothetical protein